MLVERTSCTDPPQFTLCTSALPSRTCWLSLASTFRASDSPNEKPIIGAPSVRASPICCSWNLQTILAKHFTLSWLSVYRCLTDFVSIGHLAHSKRVAALPWTSMLWSWCNNHIVVQGTFVINRGRPPAALRKTGTLVSEDERPGPVSKASQVAFSIRHTEPYSK